MLGQDQHGVVVVQKLLIDDLSSFENDDFIFQKMGLHQTELLLLIDAQFLC